MFSGIIEARSQILKTRAADQGAVEIVVARPAEFTDLRLGDSISTSGVCLTLERDTPEEMQFTLGAETLRVTGWSAANLANAFVNLERSLRFGDRIHGHLVSGHVDTIGIVAQTREVGSSFEFTVRAPREYHKYFPVKGSWTVNGVSLTINESRLRPEGVEVTSCLIPETIKRTNLGAVRPGDRVNLEVDFMLRALMHSLKIDWKNSDEHNS